MSRKHIIEGTLKSLKNMDLDYCDLVFSHRMSRTIDLEETCRAFNWLIKKGYAKYWCTSMWDNDALIEAVRLWEELGLQPPIAEQCEYSCLRRDHVEKDYRRLIERYGYGTTVWSPLCGGILTGKYNDGHIEDGARFENAIIKAMTWDRYMGDDVRENTLRILKEMKEYADELGWTQAQLALAWVIVNKDVSTCIMGATRPAQVESNIQSLKIASEWTPEREERMNKILNNEPAPRMNWMKFIPDKGRRGLNLVFNMPLGKVERKRKIIH